MGHRTKLLLTSILTVALVSLIVETVTIGALYRAASDRREGDVGAAFVRGGLVAGGATVLITLAGVLALIRAGAPLVDRLERAEESVRENEQRMRLQERALESTRDGILITDPNRPDNPIVYCNAGFERLTGYSSDDVLGRNCRFLQGNDHDQPALEAVRAAVRDQLECQVTLRNYKQGGEPFWNELTISPVRDAQQRVTHFVGIVRDVSRRKAAEERLVEAHAELEQRVEQRTAELETSLQALRTSEEQVRHARDFSDAVINSLPGVFYVFDMEGGFLRWNEKLENITGYDASELANMTPLDFFHEDDRPMIAQRVQEVFEKGASSVRADYVFKDGSSAPYLFSGIRFGSDDRQLLIGVGIDVSEQHEAEVKLRQHAKRLAVIGDIMAAVLMARSTEQIALAVLDRLEELIPCRRSGVVLFDGQLENATLLASHGTLDAQTESCRQPSHVFGDTQALRRGDVFHIHDLGRQDPRSPAWQALFGEGVREIASVPLRMEGDLVGSLILAAEQPNLFSTEHLAIAREVADPLAVGIRQAQLHAQVLDYADKLVSRVEVGTGRLAEAETRFRKVVEAMPNALIMSDPGGRIQLANAQAESLFGYTREELIGQPVELLVPEDHRAEHPARGANYLRNPQARAIGARRDLSARCKDGREVTVEIGLNPLTIDSQTYVLASIVDITERTRAEEVQREGIVLGQLQYDIHVALATRGSLRDVLQVCARAIVDHLDAAFARIWTLNESEQMLELRASAGLYTHLDGPHGRIPVGQYKIGLIAAERQPHLTNAVVGDQRVSDQEWARREGMVAFAGYPLIADDRVIGVMAMFARRELTDTTLRAMGSIAQGVALGIERIRAEDGLRAAIHDLATRTRQLEVAKEQAEAADRVKSAFLATMSHELRTPLNSIIGFTGIMTKGLAGPLNDEQTKQLGMVQGSARHLLNLINDVLDISKIEAGQFEIESKPFRLEAAVDKAVKIVMPAALQKRLQVKTEVAPEIGEILGDQRRVEQVLLNLINNAVKFTNAGEVRVSCELNHETVITRVTDTGCGIKPENLSKLFEPFQQLDSGIARHHEGTGLGLAICRRLVELMGGRISVDSTWDKGSTFSFTLPLRAAAHAPPAPPGT